MIGKACLAVLAVASGAAAAPFSPSITEPKPREVVRTYQGITPATAGVNATMYAVAADGYTDGPIYVVNITTPTHYGAGYAYGRLLGNETMQNLKALFAKELPQEWEKLVMDAFLTWQYDTYCEKSLPQSFLDEMDGIEDAGRGSGFRELGNAVRRGTALASIATGSVSSDILYLLIDEFKKQNTTDYERGAFADAVDAVVVAGLSFEEAAESLSTGPLMRLGHTCSFWGAWGSRTEGGSLFSGRNLDWAAGTGVSRFKTVTVYHIAEEIPYASVSFAGLTGAITGFSAAGITVHEAGDDNKLETLNGFPWSLRLRALMGNASNLQEAKEFWEHTNNTLGINHGVGSAADPGFMALETRAGYTAYFDANDTREAAANVNGTHYGFPMPEAVWRTNHPYDPKFIQTMMGEPRLSGDSQTRYMLLHDTFKMYESEGKQSITVLQAVNVTAVVGDKGGSTRPTFVECGKLSEEGENIVSATFHPAAQAMYLAFEDGLDNQSTHVPACCNNYIHFDMAPYFAWKK